MKLIQILLNLTIIVKNNSRCAGERIKPGLTCRRLQQYTVITITMTIKANVPPSDPHNTLKYCQHKHVDNNKYI